MPRHCPGSVVLYFIVKDVINYGDFCMTQPTNNGYTRCNNCSEVYEVSKHTCPRCGAKNPAYTVNENTEEIISENLGMVFNIID